jgi:PKD repeat protein
MVAIPDLEPLQATAKFTCSDETPCIATAVEFEDESMGEIISWNWTFEAGNPPTSTAQNPVVTYNTQGQYDVQLIVYDGAVYDTLMNPEYILVITPPVQPPAPTGPISVCQVNDGIQYTSQLVQWATTYMWTVEPSQAGTISGPDPVATFTLAPDYLGDYTIKVRADNNCGNGTWSPGLNCIANLTPSQYTLSDGSGYCEGGAGVELTLDGSQVGVNYEIYLDGDPIGQVVAGTGSPLSFGNKTEKGIYTCMGYTEHCNQQMVGNSYIFIIYPPEEGETPSGPTEQCNNLEDVTYTTEEITGASSYTWSLTPTSAGTITGNTTTASVNWNEDFAGTAQISVAGVNSCFTGAFSDNLDVTVSEAPQPAISGDQDVCDWEPGLIYSTAAVEGNTYTWETFNGHITAGAGTNEITVTWHDPGTGWVKVTESNDDCVVTTTNFDIAIEDCVGIGEGEGASFSIYPNPVKDELVIRFEGKTTDTRIMIVNELGQVVYDHMTGGNQQVNINTSEYAMGIYAVRIYGENSVTEKKFIKAE